MKKSLVVLIVLIVGVLGFTGCSMGLPTAENLVGTVWENAVLGTGERVTFTSLTEVRVSTILAGDDVIYFDYDYTYDEETLTGVIDSASEFEISEDGSELTYEGSVYDYSGTTE